MMFTLGLAILVVLLIIVLFGGGWAIAAIAEFAVLRLRHLCGIGLVAWSSCCSYWPDRKIAMTSRLQPPSSSTRAARRLPESDAERRTTIAAAMTDSSWIISRRRGGISSCRLPRSPLSPSPGAARAHYRRT